MTPIQKLKEYGFRQVGYWFKRNSQKTMISHHLDENVKYLKDLNYAFVEGDKVFYIGVTTNTLSKRMDGYKYGKASEKDNYGKVEASTNKEVYKSILKRLDKLKKITIYALPELYLNDYKGLRVSSVSGIEHSLIKEFDNGDLLNKRATKTKKGKQVSRKYISEDGKEFEMNLGQEYYNNGKIGFRERSEHLLPNETGVLMNIIIKDEKEIQGTFTRSGKTKSINGKKELIKWYSDNFKLNDTVLVKIIDPTNIELSKIIT